MALSDIQLLHLTDMSSNPGVHLAIKRLGDQAKHWYDGPLRDHRRPDVVELFQQYYDEALAAGYSVADYIPNEQLNYVKQTQRGYAANNGWE
jgi:hypothetical protein